MKKYMTTIATKHGVLEVEERNLLSVAYKNIVGARRAAWRVISSLLTTAGRTAMERKVLNEYKITVEKELDGLCEQILSMLKDTLIANSTGTEEKVVRVLTLWRRLLQYLLLWVCVEIFIFMS